MEENNFKIYELIRLLCMSYDRSYRKIVHAYKKHNVELMFDLTIWVGSYFVGRVTPLQELHSTRHHTYILVNFGSPYPTWIFWTKSNFKTNFIVNYVDLVTILYFTVPRRKLETIQCDDLCCRWGSFEWLMMVESVKEPQKASTNICFSI